MTSEIRPNQGNALQPGALIVRLVSLNRRHMVMPRTSLVNHFYEV